MRAKVYYTTTEVNGASTFTYPIDMKQVKVIEYLKDYVIVEAPPFLGLTPDDTEDKRNALTEAKKNRDAAIAAPINNFEVALPEDRENIQGAIDYFDQLSQGANYIVWTMADDTEKQVTLAELQAAKDGYVYRKAQVFADYQAIKSEIIGSQL